MKPIYAALVVFLVALQYQLWLADGGVREVNELQQNLAIQQQLQLVLKSQNQKLIRQIQYLKKDRAEIEAYARQEHNMIEKGENYFQIVD